jgi:hypothetical protein
MILVKTGPNHSLDEMFNESQSKNDISGYNENGFGDRGVQR